MFQNVSGTFKADILSPEGRRLGSYKTSVYSGKLEPYSAKDVIVRMTVFHFRNTFVDRYL